MKKSIKSLFVLLALVLAFAVAFAGCNGVFKDSENPGLSTDSSNTDSTDTSSTDSTDSSSTDPDTGSDTGSDSSSGGGSEIVGTDIAFCSEQDIFTREEYNKYVYWSAANGENGTCVADTHYLDENGVAHFAYTYTGDGTWGMQVFYKSTDNVAGHRYTVTFTLNSSVAGNITVNGQTQTLAVGNNDISVTYDEGASSASLSIVIGHGQGLIVEDNVTFTLTAPAFSEVIVPANEVPFGEEGKIAENNLIDKIFYWNDQWWTESNVVVSTHEYLSDDKASAKFAYNFEAGNTWYGFQVFYKNSTLTEGTRYTLSFKLKSSVAGKITVHEQLALNGDNTRDIIAGDNDISVVYTEGNANQASFKLQMGTLATGCIPSGEIEITDLKWEEYTQPLPQEPADVTLETPEFYNGNYFKAFITSDFDLTRVNKITVDGTPADGAHVFHAGENRYEVQFVIGTDYTEHQTYSFAFYVDDTVVAKIDNWTNPQYSAGGGSDLPEQPIEVTLESALFYNGNYFEAFITGDFNFTRVNKITIDGADAQGINIFNAGDNRYGVQFIIGTDYKEHQTYSFAFYVGETMVAKVDNWTNPEYSTGGGSNPQPQPAEGVELTFEFVEFHDTVWLKVLVSGDFEISADTFNYIAVNGQQYASEIKEVVGDKTTVDIYVADITLEYYDFEFYKDGKVVAYCMHWLNPEYKGGGQQEAQAVEVELTQEKYVEGDRAGALAAHGTMYYWFDKNWCGSSVDLNTQIQAGAIHMDYTVNRYEDDEGKSVGWAVQLFYVDDMLVSGQSYKVEMDINSNVDGYITINGTIVHLQSGTNHVSVTYTKGADVDLEILFGVKYNASAEIEAQDFVNPEPDGRTEVEISGIKFTPVD